MANQLNGSGITLDALAPSDIEDGGVDKVLLYASGSGAAARLYVKSGADTQSLLGTDLDSLTATTSSLEQTDLLLFSDQDADGVERSITLSGLEDTIFANMDAQSSDVAVAAGGRVTLANNSVGVAEVATAVAGDGLSGGGGSALAVSVDDSSIEINSDSLRVKASGVTNAMLAGSIANDKLANSAITVGGTATSLGGTITGAHIAAALNSNLGGDVTIGNQSGDTATFTGGVIVGGDLRVQGTTTTVDSTTINVSQSFTFEGPADAHETTLHCGIPGADTTITLPVLSAGTYHLAALADAPDDASAAVTAAEFALLDGGSSIGTTAVADGHGIFMNQGGTMRHTTVQTLAAYLDDEITAMPNLVEAGALDAGSITSNFGAIDVGSSNISGGTLSGSALQTDAITLNGTAISATAAELNYLDNDDLTAADITKLAALDATAAEINILDGGTAASSVTVADADRIVLNDGGTMKQVAMTDFEVYFESALDTLESLTSAKINTGGNAARGLHVTGAIAATGKISAGGAELAATGNGNQALNLVAVSQAKAAIITGSVLVNGTTEFIGAMSVAGTTTVSTGGLVVTGSVYIDGNVELPNNRTMKAQSFVTYSDRELKKNIEPMGDALDKVMKLEAVTYDMKSSGKAEIGFIAQDVAKVVPEVCALDKMGVGRGIDYSRVSTLLVGAIKTQQEQIADLKEKLDKLQK